MLVQVLVPKAEVMNKIKQKKKKEGCRIGRVKKGSSIGHRLEQCHGNIFSGATILFDGFSMVLPHLDH